MATVNDALEPVRLSLLERITTLIAEVTTLKGSPPSPGNSEHPDEETMIQVALICSAHF